MSTRISLVLLACGLLSAAPTAQQPPAAQPPSPPLTFKVEVNYVEVDASVTDEQGNFVRNLTRDDFNELPISVLEMMLALPVIAKQTGMVPKKADESGDAKPGEVPAGN